VVTIPQPSIGVGNTVVLTAIAVTVTLDQVTTTTSATATPAAIAVVVTMPGVFAFVDPVHGTLSPPLTAEIHTDDGRSTVKLSDHGNAIAHVADDAGESHAVVTDGAITRVDRT
jgi:hypothetical protein